MTCYHQDMNQKLSHQSLDEDIGEAIEEIHGKLYD